MLSYSLLRYRSLSFPNYTNMLTNIIQTAGLKNFPPPKVFDIELPPDTRGKKLVPTLKVPQYPSGLKAFKMQKRIRYMRGPELVLNKLLHKQYGVIALVGGKMLHGHFEMVRWTCGRKLPETAFARWRVDAPWQPISKKSLGTRMGGGKAAIHHYATPVKSGRVIVEVGGPIEYEEVKKVLEEIAHKLPFKALAVSQSMLDQMAEDEKYIEENNENPYTMKYIIQNNLGGCHNWIAPIDKYYFGKYR